MTHNVDVPSQGLTVYLLKTAFTDPNHIIQTKRPLEEFGIKSGREVIGRLYVQRGRPKTPRWAKFFENHLDVRQLGSVSSTAAVLLMNGKKRTFAITFGHGRHLLNPDSWEERFGLRVALNSIGDGNVRSIDKRTFDSISRHTREQASRKATARDFDIDIEQDLLRAITGTPTDSVFGRRMSGMDALQTSVPIELDSLPELLASYYQQYLDDSYKANYPWVDHIAEISNRTLIDELDHEVIERIVRGQVDRIWMAVPDVTPWERIDGFRWSGRKAPCLPDVTLAGFTDSLKDLKTLSREVLSQRKVECIDDNGMTLESWSAYRCLYVELERDRDSYLLSGGKWYRLTRSFVEEVNEAYRRIPRYEHNLPPFEDSSETAYNERVARSDSGRYALMDAKPIGHGGPRDKVEFCDLFIERKDLLHVKQYGASSRLSHLFAQGLVSGELFLTDQTFREKVNAKLPDGHKLADPVKRPDPFAYQVVFGVISAVPGDLAIPFFSRLNLKHAAKRLSGYGYRVSVAKIEVTERHAKTKRYD